MSTGTVAPDGTIVPTGTAWSQHQDTDTIPANGSRDYTVNDLATGTTARYRQGDDFTVTEPSWKIDAITVYGFRSNGTTTETITSRVIRIWNARRDAVGATEVACDLTTNRWTSTTPSGLYWTGRASASTIRPIMAATLSLPMTLRQGTYWIE